jgi:hypothetical protein
MASTSLVTDVPQTGPVEQNDGNQVTIRPPWFSWFKQVRLGANSVTESGATADRPTSSLWKGRRFFDTTLDQPIWYDGTNWVTWSAPNNTNSVLTGHYIQYAPLPGGSGASSFGAQFTSPTWTGLAFTAGNVYTAYLKGSSSGSGSTNIFATALSQPSANFPFHRGSVANTGGFSIVTVFGTGTSLAADARMYCGLTTSTTMGTNTVNNGVDSSMNDLIGVGFDSSDTNWQIKTKTGSGSVSNTNLSLAKAANQLLRLTLTATANASSVSVVVDDLTNGAPSNLATATINSSLPDPTTFLGFFCGSKSGNASNTTSYVFSYMTAQIPL